MYNKYGVSWKCSVQFKCLNTWPFHNFTAYPNPSSRSEHILFSTNHDTSSWPVNVFLYFHSFHLNKKNKTPIKIQMVKMVKFKQKNALLPCKMSYFCQTLFSMFKDKVITYFPCIVRKFFPWWKIDWRSSPPKFIPPKHKQKLNIANDEHYVQLNKNLRSNNRPIDWSIINTVN